MLLCCTTCATWTVPLDGTETRKVAGVTRESVYGDCTTCGSFVTTAPSESAVKRMTSLIRAAEHVAAEQERKEKVHSG